MPLTFDERKLVQSVESLPRAARIAFAALVAERLFPAYSDFSRQTGRGDASSLRAHLDRVWLDLEGDVIPALELDERIEKTSSLGPSEAEGPWIDLQAQAEDAAAAVAYALRTIKTGSSQEAAWAARRCYEAIDNFVINRDRLDTTPPGAEVRILGDPLIQQELRRQQRDLAELHEAASSRMIHFDLERLKTRAAAESASVFRISAQ
jgi:uncharacterized protein YjaG (DUF416 family)